MKSELLRQVVAELAEQIVGSRIAKIHQPSADLILLRLWTGRENLKLLISAAAQDSRIHLTEQAFPNPFTPPRFCQLLRARLSRINGIRQINDDRIVELACQGPKGDCRLIIELTGKSSNLILLADDGRVIDVLKRPPLGRVSPGDMYQVPEKIRMDAAEQLVESEGQGVTASETVEKLYIEQATVNTTDLKSRLQKLIGKEQKKLVRRLKNIQQEHDRQVDFEHYRQQGDLLLSNLQQLKRGMQQVEVENYYLQPPVEETIPLDPLLSPQDNAEKYYRKYKKARRGLEHSGRRLAETEQEIQWLELLDYQLSEATEPAEIGLVADELKRAGLLKEKAAKLPRLQNVAKSPLHELVSPGGFKVLWGVNSKQNDTLSTRMLSRGDLWFHACRCPGSHVVLKADSGCGDFTDDDLLFAASVAAAHSKARHDTKVEVIVAQAKDVKKPSGAKPGLVTVKEYKTLVVKPFSEN